MTDLRHVVLSAQGSHGFQYGMLRDLEGEIARITGASTVAAPRWPGPRALGDRLAHGTRLSPLRAVVPRLPSRPVEADVLWMVLMGPESSDLDLFRAWDRKVGYRILYLFDTFANQLPAIRRLLEAARWDLLVTSFHGAVPMLERETGRAWCAVPQGVLLDRFTPPRAEERVIGVTSYGRRVEPIHETLAAWAEEQGVYYDATVAASIQASASPAYLYRQYAFHLRHAFFTVAWPVELTNPARAGSFSPMTCRWFEAAASGTTMIGAAPTEPVFAELFGAGAVIPLDPRPRSPAETREALAELWKRRHELLAAAEARRAERAHRWTWEARVREMLDLARL